MSRSSNAVRSSEEPYVVIRPSDIIKIGNTSATVVYLKLSFWFTPNKNGGNKLRVRKGGKFWLVRSVKEIARETGLSYREAEYAYAYLKKNRFIETGVWKFKNSPTLHIRLVPEEERLAELPVHFNKKHVEEMQENSPCSTVPEHSILCSGTQYTVFRNTVNPESLTVTDNSNRQQKTPNPTKCGESVSQKNKQKTVTETGEEQVKGNVSNLFQDVVSKIRVIPDKHLPYKQEQIQVTPPLNPSRNTPRALGLNPRALGTNPRSIHVKQEEAARAAKQNRWRSIFSEDPKNPLAKPEAMGSLTEKVLGYIGARKSDANPSGTSKPSRADGSGRVVGRT